MRQFRNLLLLFNTLRHLKWQQIYFRLVRKLIKPKVTEKRYQSKPQRSKAWKHHTLYNDKIDIRLDAFLLNFNKKLDFPADWNEESPNKLWVYNLHYFEDLLSDGAQYKKDFHVQLLNRWINENPVGYGNGWEPYPISLRVVNIFKAWLGGLELNKEFCSSVFSQVSFLSNCLEKHILGNHYFVNLKALLFAGVIFGNTKWLKIAESGLLDEIPEQVLKDGANFELSPMYHSLMLVDMLDMFNLSRAYPDKLSNNLSCLLEKYIPKMLIFMESMTHPDGGVSFFNDSVDGIAPTKVKIESYAKKLGFEINSHDYNKPQVIDNKYSGYICGTHAGNKIIFDASPIGPDYIPAHSHADTLSFELSIGKQRVFVNSGISEYGVSKTRLYQRKTKSHNTLEIDGKDSSQVWGGFRVANRARILNRFAELNEDNLIILEASHNGYKSLFGGCIHTRKLLFGDNELSVIDSITGSYEHAIARFHIHPNLKTNFVDNFLKIEGDNFILSSDLNGINAKLTDTTWHPEFGITKYNKLLEIHINNGELEINFNWNDKNNI